MPITNWSTTVIDGVEYLVIDVAKFRIPLDWDPNSNMFIAVAAPDGALGGLPALVAGADGSTPDIDTTINLTELDFDDPTPASASFAEISDNLYRLTLALHQGPQGDAAAFDLEDADNLTGTMLAGRMIVVNSTADGFTYAPQPVGDMFWPASIASAPSGNSAFTLCDVSIPAQPFDWRPEPMGWCVITGTGFNVQPDLIARLNNETAGNIVGRGRGRTGLNPEAEATVLTAGPPAGSANTYNKVNAGDPATVYLRVERQSGSNTFTTTDAATYFAVKVNPIP